MKFHSMVNGKVATDVSVRDRGLAYGDGVFETLRVNRGVPVLWRGHWARLAAGLRQLKIAVPENFEGLCAAHLDQLIQHADLSASQCVAKLIVTRGEGGRGYRPGAGHPNLIVSLHPLPVDLSRIQQDGMRVKVVAHRLPRHPGLAGIKHLNRLDQVLASLELSEQDDEGLLLDVEGSLIEGTKTNVMLFTNNSWWTPELSACGVAGVLRDFLLDECEQLGVKVRVRSVAASELQSAEAVVLFNSVIGLCPVRELNNIECNIPDHVRALQTYIHEKLSL